MKRFILLVSFVIFISGALCADVVKNPDKPLKGEWDFKCEKVWQIEGYHDELLAMVQQYAVHDNGDIYIFDRRHFKFFVFDKSGKPKLSFGKRGEGPGEIKQTLGFFLLGDKVVVSDMGKIHYFALDGKYIKSVPTSSMIGIAPLLFIDENRLVKTRLGRDIMAGPEALEMFNLTGNTTLYLDGKPVPPGEKANRGVRMIIRVGTEASERGIAYVTGKISGKLFWGKSDTYLIKACDFSGKEEFAFAVEGRKLKKITQKYKEESVARINIRTSGSRSVEEIKKRMIGRIPDYSTYFSRISAGPGGLIYVYISDAMRLNGQEIDIFSPTGKYLYHADIDFPEVTRFIANGLVLKDDSLYVAVEEESGDFTFRKYSILDPKE